MFVTKNQIFIFIVCLSFGGTFGTLLGFSSLAKKKFDNIFIGALGDTLIFALIALCFAVFSFKMNFPNLRAYMILGVFLGIYIYFKSFNIILAKFAQKLYNRRVKNKQKVKNDKRQEKKAKISGNSGRGIVPNNHYEHSDLPMCVHIVKKKAR